MGLCGSLPENHLEGDPIQYRGFISDIKGVKSNDMWIAGDSIYAQAF